MLKTRRVVDDVLIGLKATIIPDCHVVAVSVRAVGYSLEAGTSAVLGVQSYYLQRKRGIFLAYFRLR